MINRFLFFVFALLFTIQSFAQQVEPQSILPHHNGDLNCMALSETGILASGGSDRLINLYRADSTQIHVRTISGLIAPVHALRFSRDGRLLAAGCSDNSIHIYDSVYNHVKVLENHTNKVNTLLFDASRKYLFSGSDDRKVLLWDMQKGTVLRTIDFGQPVLSLAQTKNPQQIYVAGFDPRIKVINLASSKVEKTFDGHTDIVNAIAISPDGQWMVSGSNDKTARIWDLKSGKEYKKLGVGCWKVTSVAFSRDGKYIVTGCNDGSLKMWDAATGSLISAAISEGENIRAVELMPNSSAVYSAVMLRGKNNYGVRVWQSKLNQYLMIQKLEADSLKNIKPVPVDSSKLKPALINKKAPKRR